jgi:hypothetical protein
VISIAIGAEMAYISRNIDTASDLKFSPGILFSEELEKYIVELADVHSVHADSFAVMLINCVAATLEFSFVLRANRITNKIPTNLYNILVARSCKVIMVYQHRGHVDCFSIWEIGLNAIAAGYVANSREPSTYEISSQ